LNRTRADKRGGKFKNNRVRVKVEVHSYRFFKRCRECGYQWTENLNLDREKGYG